GRRRARGVSACGRPTNATPPPPCTPVGRRAYSPEGETSARPGSSSPWHLAPRTPHFPMPRLLRRFLLPALLLAGPVLAAHAQQMWYGEGRYGRPIREGLPERREGFMFCRLQYRSVRAFRSGMGW